jgi:ribonuclease E
MAKPEPVVEEAPAEPESVVEPVDAPAAEKPQVSTRSRRRSANRPAGEPVPVVEEAPVVEPESVVEPDSVVEPAEAPAAEKPQVSTRSRRRSANRPAGEPEPVVEAPVVEAPVVEAPVVEPVETPVAAPPVAPVETPEVAAPEPPKVVTRTRRRAASRPAGPPAAEDGAELPPPVGTVGSVGAPPVDGIVEPGTGDAEPGSEEHPHVEHVPIKKKGSRKR